MGIKAIVGYLGTLLICVLLIVYGMRGGGVAWITTAITLFCTVFGFSAGAVIANIVNKKNKEIACLEKEVNSLKNEKV
jgi:hypothetical protein